MKTFGKFVRMGGGVAIGLAVVSADVVAFDPQPEPPRVAQAAKIRAAARMASCQAKVISLGLVQGFDPQPEPPREDWQKCSAKFEDYFAKAESRCAASGAVCPSGDPGLLGLVVDAMSTRLQTFVSQEIGVTPRFVDNGDGTTTDTGTGLQWEQKTGMVATSVDCSATPCPDPHDVNNTYSWTSIPNGTAPDGTVFSDFLDELNDCSSMDGTTISGGFAGHCDWRLPTISELQAILDMGAPGCGSGGSCIDPAFGTLYPSPIWSATTNGGATDTAWMVFFFDGLVFPAGKEYPHEVRAVRGGS